MERKHRQIFTIVPLVHLALHHWSWLGEWPMQNQTSKADAGYEGKVCDMDEWMTSCYKMLLAL